MDSIGQRAGEVDWPIERQIQAAELLALVKCIWADFSEPPVV